MTNSTPDPRTTTWPAERRITIRDLANAKARGERWPMLTAYDQYAAEIFDEAALYGALASGKLAGAALDVWYRYPTSTGPTAPATQPFHELGNVIMTPHISGWTEGMLEARSKLIADNIARTARGEMPLNVIKPAS